MNANELRSTICVSLPHRGNIFVKKTVLVPANHPLKDNITLKAAKDILEIMGM
jgi:hypothetical protein